MLLICKSWREFEWWYSLALIRSECGDIVILLLPIAPLGNISYQVVSPAGITTRSSDVIDSSNTRKQFEFPCGVTNSGLIVQVEMFTVTHTRPRWAHVYLIKLDSIWSVYNYPTPWNKLYYYYCASFHGLYLFTSHHSNPEPAHRILSYRGGACPRPSKLKNEPCGCSSHSCQGAHIHRKLDSRDWSVGTERCRIWKHPRVIYWIQHALCRRTLCTL